MARNTDKRRTDARSEEQVPSDRSRTENPNIQGSFDEGEIARRAYRRFEERGYEHGRDMDDWLEAERELRQPGTRQE